MFDFFAEDVQQEFVSDRILVAGHLDQPMVHLDGILFGFDHRLDHGLEIYFIGGQRGVAGIARFGQYGEFRRGLPAQRGDPFGQFLLVFQFVFRGVQE